MTRWTHGLINRLVILCDIAMAALAAIFAEMSWDFLSWSQLTILWLIAIFTYVQILQFGRAYRVEHYSRVRRQIAHIIIGGVPAAAAVAVCYFAMLPADANGPGGLLGWCFVTVLALLFGRLVLVRRGMGLVQRRGVAPRCRGAGRPGARPRPDHPL